MNATHRNRSLPASSPALEDDIQVLRETLITTALRTLAFVVPFALAAGTYESYLRQDFWTLPFYWGAYFLLLLVTLLRKAPYLLKVLSLALLLYVMAFVDLFQDARAGSGTLFLLSVLFLVSLLLSRRAALFTLLLITLTLGGFGFAFAQGYLPPPAMDLTNPANWTAGTLVLFMVGLLIVASNTYIIPRLAQITAHSRGMAQDLQAYQDSLEAVVTERTADLAQRNRELEAAARVARQAAEFQDVEDLLAAAVRLIPASFGFYHAGIFLLDEDGRYAILRAASSEGGARMLARGHRLRVGEVGIVGDVAQRGAPRIALDVGADAKFFNNPDLPDTRSEMALPLRARGQVIGVLDVQSTAPEAFDQRDAANLQTLADQIALAIANARLLQQLQASLEAERQVYGKLSREAWNRLFSAQQHLGKRYDPQQLLSAEPALADFSAPAEPPDVEVLSLPIEVRGQPIGTLRAYRPREKGGWSPDLTAVLENLTGQLGQALESARLYQDTQRRAAHEQFVSEATTRIRETLDLETVLQTAVREMQAGLGLAEAEIRLGVEWGPSEVRTGPLPEPPDTSEVPS